MIQEDVIEVRSNIILGVFVISDELVATKCNAFVDSGKIC